VNTFSRKTFAVEAVACALAPRALCAQPLTAVRIASAPDEDILGALWALDSGAFRKAGLDVTIQKANSGAAVAAAVLGGSIEIGKSSLVALITAHAKGLPLVVVAPAALYDAKDPTVALVVAKDSPAKSGADLNGKTLSVSSLNDQNAIAMEAWIDQHGGDAKTVKFIELPSAAAPDAVAAGRVDAATLGTPILSEALQSGKCRILGRSFDAIANRFVLAAYFCTAEYAAKHRDAVDRFRNVIFSAARYVNGHHAETVPTMAKFTRIDPSIIAAMPREELAVNLDPQLMQPLIEAATHYKAIAASFDARTLFAP
jgi:ABC-type nitrate/sulfonate/bicarbonate transport system substrate-binding protein